MPLLPLLLLLFFCSFCLCLLHTFFFPPLPSGPPARRPRAKAHPSSRPCLPAPDILENPTLQRYAVDLAVQLDVRRNLAEQCAEID